MPEPLVDGARWVLAIVFSLSLAEKLLALRSNSAAWHPVLVQTAWTRRHARVLMSLSFVADLVAVVLLVVVPSLGGVAGAALLLAYTGAAWRLHDATQAGPCRCFYGLLNTSNGTAFLLRNTLLFTIALTTLLEPIRAMPQSFSAVPWAMALMGSVMLASRFGLRRPQAAARDVNSVEGEDGRIAWRLATERPVAAEGSGNAE